MIQRWAFLLLMPQFILSCSANFSGSLRSSGENRSYLLHLPKGREHEGSLPLVVALHGAGGNARHMMWLSGFDDLADEKGFAVVYPESDGMQWNDGRSKEKKDSAQDVQFISELVDELLSRRGFDRSRIYVVGVSNGGVLTHRLACEKAEKFAGAASVISALGEETASRCKPSRKVPFLMISSTQDPLVPFNGGCVGFKGCYGRVLSARQSFEFWSRADGCARPGDLSEFKQIDPSMKTTLERRGCGSAEVRLYRVEGAGHTWPGGPQYMPSLVVGPTSRDFSASSEIWDFFSHFRRIGQ